MITKVFLKPLLGAVILCVGITSCDNEKPVLDSQAEQTIQTPEKIIPVSKAINYYNNFYNTRIAGVESSAVKENRAVWFEFDMLDSYLSELQKVSEEKGIEITQLAFLLGADSQNKRTVFLAPMAYDKDLGFDRAFSFDDNKITFLHADPTENYSSIQNFDRLNGLDQSIILGTEGKITSARAIKLYNNYFDNKLKQISGVVKQDTRIVSYAKGEFENYINYMKQQQNITKIDVSGVYMVFGVYDDNPINGKNANHQTLFFVPTTQDENGRQSFASFGSLRSSFLDFEKNILSMKGIDETSKQNGGAYNEGSSNP